MNVYNAIFAVIINLTKQCVMYLDFYKLKESPFNITSDPEFIFRSKHHTDALACILYGVEHRKGILLITGEVGTGKTTLCRAMLKELPAGVVTSLVLNPYFSEVQLLRAIIEDFGITPEKNSRLDLVNFLNTFLLDTTLKGGNAVLIIDEAQNLTIRQLEQIRLLSNLETEKNKLLQVILVGQPELNTKLNLEAARQIKQRIAVKYHILPLQPDEISEYVVFRLARAGGKDINFLPETFPFIYRFSRGIPRLINILCDRALLLGFTLEKRHVDEQMIQQCIEELT